MANAEDLDDFAATLDRPRHREMFAYWRSKMPPGAPPGRLPDRKQIDPVEIPKLLPWFSLIDVDWAHGTPRFRFRSVGTGVVERFGRNARGRWFEDLYSGEFFERQMAAFTAVATTGLPALAHIVSPIANKEFLRCHRLILPLATDGRRVGLMISLLDFDNEPRGSAGARV